MAEISPTGTNPVTWTSVTPSDTTVAYRKPSKSDVCVQVTGVGTSIDIEGSNDGTNFVTLVDMDGVALSFTADGINTVRDNVAYIRPKVPVGGSVTVTMNMTGPK